MPTQFLGAVVVNGDKADDIMLNVSGVILGLKAKGLARHDVFGFVVK